ncbi:hypothetical protein [Mucilaginibacter sp.]|uniref:hypothetical protein n=1 Tax=Mucilaginibacter sp. TaxID=1882438 RepID=UPI002607EF0D|nr:hypothetical protein [Mucilaginibacter sp.]MDB4926134.1 hypothetical protein [Mucilaginibacter sp.]
MNKSKEEKIVFDRMTMGVSIRNLALKYGVSASRIYRIVKNNKITRKVQAAISEELPDDIASLKALLRKERLKNELLNNIIDIADKELGANIRKKSGTRRSE